MIASTLSSPPPWFIGSPQRWRRLCLDWAFISKGMLLVARLRLAASIGAIASLVFAILCLAFWGSDSDASAALGGLAAFGLCLSLALPVASRSFALSLKRRQIDSLRFCSTLISQGAIAETLLPERPPRRTLEAHVNEALSRLRNAPVVTVARAVDSSGRSIELDILPPR